MRGAVLAHNGTFKPRVCQQTVNTFGNAPDSTQTADQPAPRAPRFSEVRRPTPPALRRAPAPFVRRGRTAGGGRRATHPATEPRQSAPRLQTPSVRSPRPSVADHASPAWRAVAPRHAHPIGSPPMQMNSLRDSRRLRPSDPVPLPVFSLLTLSFPPSAFAQSGE